MVVTHSSRLFLTILVAFTLFACAGRPPTSATQSALKEQSAKLSMLSRFSEAAGRGDMAGAKQIIDQGLNINDALCSASRSEHPEVVQMVIDMGADVNAKDWQGGLPLMSAFSHSAWTCSSKLRGSPLQAACFGKQREIVQILLDKGADVNAMQGDIPVFSYAFVGGREKDYDTELLQMMLDNGADVRKLSNQDLNNKLIAACRVGNRGFVQKLVDKGADVNFKTEDGDTPLIIASKDHPELRGLLIKAGAKHTKQNDVGDLSKYNLIPDGYVSVLVTKGDMNTDPQHATVSFSFTTETREFVIGEATLGKIEEALGKGTAIQDTSKLPRKLKTLCWENKEFRVSSRRSPEKIPTRTLTMVFDDTNVLRAVERVSDQGGLIRPSAFERFLDGTSQ